MRKRQICLRELMERIRRMAMAAVAAVVSLPAMAGYAPQSVKKAFEALYPDIELDEVIWSNEDEGWYLAKFQCDGFATKAWFNEQAQCDMVQTDIETMDRVPAEVYNAYAVSDYGNYVVRDVTYVVFPRWQPIYVVLVGEQNLEGAYQIFYSPYGELLKVRSTVGIGEPLGPSTFIEQN